jgi:carbamoyltransferase
MEFGARALGNRSILADPRSQDVVRVINRMVKKRDFWMPFAPMVKTERQLDYIQNPKGLRSPFMMMTFDTKENFRDLIAAVHNADLTCRAQILSREQNPPVYDILTAFEHRTGSGIVLNTSFNLHGYPIVRTAEDALGVLRDSGLEYLQVGNYLVHKPNRLSTNGSTAR